MKINVFIKVDKFMVSYIYQERKNTRAVYKDHIIHQYNQKISDISDIARAD